MALSFFKKKKKHPESPPEAVDSGHADSSAPDKRELAPAESSQPDPQAIPLDEPPDEDSDQELLVNSRIGFFKRLKNGLSKTRRSLSGGLESIFAGKGAVDDELLESLEELLITSDVGVQTTLSLVDRISSSAKRITDVDQLKKALKTEVLSFFSPLETERPPHSKPHVIMVVGVNGVGKTTTIGKLAAHEKAAGNQVLIAAADTFRAAAIEQLGIWADRAGADMVRHKENADPAAVAYDAIDAALARDIDVVLIDTAGRLHTRVNLMEELKKIKRTIAKRLPGAPHEVLLILDATTGQNAISQANLFNEALDVTGIALTKLDGTAKGGIVISICDTLRIPLKYLGVGESIEDLQQFDPEAFVEALF